MNNLRRTYRLNIKMPVNENSLLLWIVTDSAKDGRREINGLVFEFLLTQRNQFRLDAILLELAIQPECHLYNIVATIGLSADTVEG